MQTQRRAGVHVQLHGTGSVPIKGDGYAGGIFGGPSPMYRSGMFASHWALPEYQAEDNTIDATMTGNNLPDRYQRASGLPTRGLGACHGCSGLGLDTSSGSLFKYVVWGAVALAGAALLFQVGPLTKVFK